MAAKILHWPRHMRHHCAPTCEGCVYCVGGLMHCTRCGGSEGELPSDCPGLTMTSQERKDVMRGILNYTDREGWEYSDA